MTSPAPHTPGVLPQGRLRRGALGFAVLTVAGLAGLFVFGTPEGPLPGLADLQPTFLVLAAGCALLDVVLGGYC